MKAEDLKGKIFGHLMAIKRVPNKFGRTYWSCQCSCGNKTEVSSHNLKSKKVKSCGCSLIGINKKEKHGLWKTNPSYKTLHTWIGRNKPHTDICERCGKNKKTEAANISGNYLRDINDFEWLCRKCHMSGDGRLEKYSYRKGTNPTIGKTWLVNI